jgi:hypothetical protein
MAAMVSRSADGDFLVPSLYMRNVVAVRGSSRSRGKDKGGRVALAKLTEYVLNGSPALLALDGPQGPRNHVHRGIAELAVGIQAVIVPFVVIPSRRWLLSKTWGRFQIPKPFCSIGVYFGETLDGKEFSDPEVLKKELAQTLDAIESHWDFSEAMYQGRTKAERRN